MDNYIKSLCKRGGVDIGFTYYFIYGFFEYKNNFNFQEILIKKKMLEK